MGCGLPGLRFFNIHLMDTCISENPNEGILKPVVKETFTSLDGYTLLDYLEKSKNFEIERFLKDKYLYEESIFHLVFDDKSVYVAEYDDAKYFIPKDRYAYFKKETSAIHLSHVFIIPIFKLHEFYLTKQGFYRQIEKANELRDVKFSIGEEENGIEYDEDDESQNSTSSAEKKKNKEEILIVNDNIPNESNSKINNDDSITSYDSDSSMSIDDIEVDDSEVINCKGNIDEGILFKIENVMNKEKNDQKKLVQVEISNTKVKETTVIEGIIDKIKYSNDKKVEYKPHFLTSFHFYDNIIEENVTDSLWTSICLFLESKKTFPGETLTDNVNKVLRELNLSGNRLDDKNLISIVKSIRNVRLHLLDFSSNSLTDLKYLCHWILKNKSLMYLYLQYNPIKSDSIENLLQSIKTHTRLELINLSYINLSNKGKVLGDLYSGKDTVYCRIKELILKECSLTVDDIVNLQEASSSKRSCLERLDLSSNNKTGNSEFNQRLIEFISKSTSLNSINISNNSINQYDLIVNQILSSSFQVNQLSSITISSQILNYFSILTEVIGNIRELQSKLKKEVELYAVNDMKKELDVNEINLNKDFINYKTKLNIHFQG